MPRVESGSYASATISTSLTADSHAKGGEAMASAATFTVNTVTPKRVSAPASGVRIEDIAAVGQANFESILRENLSLKLSDELGRSSDQRRRGQRWVMIFNGILMALTDPSDPTAVADFDAFAAAHASGIDGLWANSLKDVSDRLWTGHDVSSPPELFRRPQTYKGEMSAAAYATKETGGLHDEQAHARCRELPSSRRYFTGWAEA